MTSTYYVAPPFRLLYIYTKKCRNMSLIPPIIPPVITPPGHKVKEPHVAEKDPHHEQQKERKKHDDVEDTIDTTHEEQPVSPSPKHPRPQLPGHIDIDA